MKRVGEQIPCSMHLSFCIVCQRGQICVAYDAPLHACVMLLS